MKRTTFTIGLILLTFVLSYGQGSYMGTGLHPSVPKSIPQRPHAATERGTEFYIDYDYSDYLFWGGDIDPEAYQYFIWNSNMRYQINEGDTAWNYCIVAFDTLYDWNTGQTIENTDVSTFNIDSIYMIAGHENNSGLMDTIIIKVIKLASTGFPGSTVIWSDTTYTDVSLSDPDWLNSVVMGWEVNYSSTIDKRFGVKIEYYGAKEDTFGFLAGFPNKGATGSCTLSAYQSSFYPNSYSYWMQFAVLVPTSDLGDVYYDCNNSGDYEPDEDGANFMQNISIWSKVNLDLVSGVDEIKSNIENLSVSPNPSNGVSQISFALNERADVTVNLYDVAGRLIKTIDKGNLAKGKHFTGVDVSTLSSGIYMLAVQAGAQTLTNKLVVGQ
jgi:hypothetical protein